MKFVLNPNSLQPEDWNRGKRLWFIDWIGPFAASDTRALRAKMAERFPREVARALRVKPGQSKARIATFAGSALTREEAKLIRADLYSGLHNQLRNHPERNVGFELQ